MINIKSWNKQKRNNLYIRVVEDPYSNPSFVSICVCDACGNLIEGGELLQIQPDGIIMCSTVSPSIGLPVNPDGEVRRVTL